MNDKDNKMNQDSVQGINSRQTNENSNLNNNVNNKQAPKKRRDLYSENPINEQSAEGFLPNDDLDFSQYKSENKRNYFERIKQNPDEVIYQEEPDNFDFSEQGFFKKALLFVLLFAPSAIIFFASQMFKDFCLTQMAYQIALVLIMKFVETITEVDYAIILIKDMRFVKKQMRSGFCHLLFFSFIIPIILSVVCAFGFYQVPIGIDLLLPLLEVPNSEKWETFFQIIFLSMYLFSFTVTLPVIEQRYFYQFILGQIGRNNFLLKLAVFLGHFSTFLIEIFRAFYGHNESYILFVAIGYQFVMTLWYISDFGSNGFISSVMNQISKNLMLWILVVLLYFSDFLNDTFDLSYFINGKNAFDCVFYGFLRDNQYHC